MRITLLVLEIWRWCMGLEGRAITTIQGDL